MFATLVLTAVLAATAPRPFHVQLESNAASTFPLVKRFGATTVDLYPAGFRIKTVWLRGFSRNGSKRFTVENPVSRTYVTMPTAEAGSIVRALGGRPLAGGAPSKIEVMAGAVRGLAARRFRLIYAPNEYIDVWTTSALGPTPEYRAFVEAMVRSIAPKSVSILKSIPGTPLYVELNMGEHRKLAVLRPRSVVYNRAGEAEALKISSWMFPAPFGTIFK
jgi:hypothetical protein